MALGKIATSVRRENVFEYKTGSEISKSGEEVYNVLSIFTVTVVVSDFYGILFVQKFLDRLSTFAFWHTTSPAHIR